MEAVGDPIKPENVIGLKSSEVQKNLRSVTKPSAPPEGWKEKYLDPLKKKSPKLAEDLGTGNYKTYENERMRRKHNVPSPQQINKERKLSYMLQKDLPPPKNKSIF